MKVLIAIARFVWTLALAGALVAAIVAILVWGYAVVGVAAWERTALDEDVREGDWLWIDEQPIYVRQWGQPGEPTVVLVHGYSVEGLAVWQATARDLADAGLHVVAVDLRGFGRSVRDLTPSYSVRSQAETLAKALNQLGVRDATLVGHGWGGAVALQLALEQPQFVQRVALLAPILRDGVSPLWRSIVRLPYLGRAAVWAVSSGGPLWRANQTAAFFDRQAIPRGYWDQVLAPTRIEGTAEALRMMALSPPDSDIPAGLQRVQVPVLVLLGQQDGRVPYASVEPWVSQLPDAQVVVIANAGHALQIEQAGQVNARLADFALRGVR